MTKILDHLNTAYTNKLFPIRGRLNDFITLENEEKYDAVRHSYEYLFRLQLATTARIPAEEIRENNNRIEEELKRVRDTFAYMLYGEIINHIRMELIPLTYRFKCQASSMEDFDNIKELENQIDTILKIMQ